MRVAAFLLLLGACSAEPRRTDPRAQTVSTLQGEWKVAAIDGRKLDEPLYLILRADDREILWEPRCAGLVRSYRIEGSNFRSGPALPTEPAPPGVPTRPVCAIGLPPGLDAAMRALDQATEIRRTEGNGILLSSGGGSLLLFSR